MKSKKGNVIATTVKTRNRSNLHSPSKTSRACSVQEIDQWFRDELRTVGFEREREIILAVYESLNEFVRWPKRAILLWPGRTRADKYHKYHKPIKDMATAARVVLDGRVNGPAIAAYCISEGERPKRVGSNNCWSVHHIYSGKFPHPGRETTLHAAHDGLHCTQSAGLVAVHPIADQMCDEYPCFSWLLRAKAFEKFSYDPDGVFSTQPHDEHGFVGEGCHIVSTDAVVMEQ